MLTGFYWSHLVGHEICQKHDVTPVDAHSVVHHGVLNLVDDGGSSSLNTQSLLNLEKYMVKSPRSIKKAEPPAPMDIFEIAEIKST